MNFPKTYLGGGGGVYIKIVNGDIILTTENGYEATNIVVLEPEVFSNFKVLIDRLFH